MDLGAWLVLAVPLLFGLGPWVTLAVLLVLVLEASNSDRLLSRDEKRQLAKTTAEYWARLCKLLTALRLAGGRASRAVSGATPLAPDQK